MPGLRDPFEDFPVIYHIFVSEFYLDAGDKSLMTLIKGCNKCLTRKLLSSGHTWMCSVKEGIMCAFIWSKEGNY